MSKVDIIGLGEVVVDWVAQLDHYPKPDEKIDALSENLFSGGVTANFLVAVARLGVKCGFIGAVGDDDHGRFLIEDFIKENVDIYQTIIKKGVNTPVNFIFVAEGEKTIIQSPHMQVTKISPEELEEAYLAQAKILHTTIIHPEIASKAFQIAKKYDIKISIDLESQIAQKGWNKLKNLLLQADILIPNKEGAKSITNTNNVKEAAKVLIKRGIPIVIITMGKKGALITTTEYQKEIPAFRVEKIIDTTGAGDTFNGAFSVAYWIKGWDLEESVRYANAAAALKIQELGARTGMPTESALEAYYNKI